MALSDTWLKANEGKERKALEERGDRDGLGVRITPKGRITFQVRFYYDCPRRPNFDHPCRLNIDQEWKAARRAAFCG